MVYTMYLLKVVKAEIVLPKALSRKKLPLSLEGEGKFDR